MSSVLETLIVKITGDVSELDSSLAGAGKSIQNVGASMTATGKSLTAGLTLPIVAAGAGIVATTNEFNSGMANIASLGTEAAANVEAWSPLIQGVAVSVGKSTSDMTDGMYNVVSAFGVADDSLQVLEINAKASAAGLASTTDAINLTSAVTKAYGDTSAASVQQVADLALQTVQLGQTTFPELASSIGTVAPLSASLGVSMEQLFGVLATGTGVTGTASEVSTQFRGILQSLMAPTADMTNLISEWGFESGAAAIEAMGVQDVIDSIIRAADESGQPLQKYISSIEGQTLAMALANGQSDAFYEKTLAMADAAGATEQAFLAQTAGVNAVGFSMQQAGVQVQVWAQQIGAALMPVLLNLFNALTPVVEKIQFWIDKFTALSPQTQMIIFGVIGLVAAIGPLLIVAGMVVSGIGAIVGVLGLLSAPILLVGGLFVALAVIAVQNWSSIQVIIQNVLTYIQGLIQNVMTAIQGFWATNGAMILATAQNAWSMIQTIITTVANLILSIVQTILTAIQNFWAQHGAAIMATVQQTFTIIWSTIDQILNAVFNIVMTILTAIQNFWDAHGATIMNVVLNAFNFIFNTVATIIQAVFTTISTILDAVASFWNAHGEQIMSWVQAYFQNGFDTISSIMASVQQFIETVLSAIQAFWDAHGATIMTITNQVFTTIQNFISSVMSAVKSIIAAILAAIRGDWTQFGANLRTATDTMMNAIKTLISNGSQIIRQIFSNLVTAIKNIFTSVNWGSVGSAIINGIKNGITSGVGAIKDAARSAAQAALDAAKAFLGISSPSRLFKQVVGLPISQGIGVGIGDGSRFVTDALTKTLNDGVTTAGEFIGRGAVDNSRKTTIEKVILPAATGGSVLEQLSGLGRV